MDWTNVVVVLISIGGSGLVGWLVNRRKDGASVGLINAQTDTERGKAQAEMQRQIDSLFDELTEARARIRQLEDSDTAREREIDNMRVKWEAEVNTLRARVAHLEAENERQRSSMRRLINQLRREKIKPDLDPADIEELFKGT